MENYDDFDSQTIHKTVMKIIAGHFGLVISDLRVVDNLVDDLGADELDQKELIITVEERFRIRLNPDELAGIKKLGDIIEVVQKHYLEQKNDRK